MSSTTLWDVLEVGDIKVKKIHTKDNPADMLIKWFSEPSLVIAKTLPLSFQLLELDGAHLNALREA